MKTDKAELVLTNEETYILARWVNRQRCGFKENTLSQNQIDKLNSIGFTWDAFEGFWNKHFENLLTFKKKHGNSLYAETKFLYADKKNKPLISWISRQRMLFKEGNLLQERIDKLNSIGFIWDYLGDLWNENFEKLLIFKKKYGHTIISRTNKKYYELSRWVMIQRIFFHKNILLKERINKLNSIDFNWSPRSSIWGKNFEKLLIFKKKYGHMSLPISPLATWVSHQRRKFRENTLSQEWIDKLNSIGFVWNTDED